MRSREGLSLVELLVATAILTIICGAGYVLFASTLSYWKISDSRTDLQTKLNRGLEKISLELQESGFDSTGAIKVSMQDNAGVSSSDILRFAIPICLCGMSMIDSNADVKVWGAPVDWGQAGCGPWATDDSGLVTVCHVPGGAVQTISINPNAVKAHLGHDDYLGICEVCDTTSYTNRWIEYRLDNSNRLMRRVLDQNFALVSEASMTLEVTDFQTSIDAAQGIVTLTLTLRRTLAGNRTVTVIGSLNVILRNRG